ncbi:MAG: transglycosylase domain-containing protein [Candidatus Gracilibacteria bacterium]|nr:transglycosylase domain-containing protein [Candidatus Gracilibacteria bacterium]
MKKNIKIIITAFIILAGIYLINAFLLPLKLNEIPYSTIIFDSNSIEIGELVYENKIRHRELVFDEIPEFYRNSIIAIEDKSFYYNNGISLEGLARSTINNIKSRKIVEGGSTISSQFIRNNFWLNEKRSFGKKILEFVYAMRLNGKYSKNEILTKYLNSIYYGYLNYGLKSASIYYFAKNPQSLTKAEQIALMILPKNPEAYNPYKNKKAFQERFTKITNYLEQSKIISNEEKELILKEKLVFNNEHKNKLPYVADFIEKTVGNSVGNADLRSLQNSLQNPTIKTTIDYNLSKKIGELGENILGKLAWKDVSDYSLIILDRKNNNLKVMIGGLNYYSKVGQVNSSLALRQPGSTIKPFTYTLAFKNLGLKPEDTVLDLPVQYETDKGYAYTPKNYSLDYKGEITIAEALSQSINIPAVRITEQLGVRNVLDFLKKVGITSLDKDEDTYGLAITLGDGEMSLYELTQAYSIFANDGNLCKISYIDGEKQECKNVIEKKYIDITNFILTNRYFKLNGFPINSTLDFPDKEVFLKTGTSRNFRDNWTIGYTSNYIIGVWSGNKDGSFMKGVSGASGAGEIFASIVNNLEKDNKENKPVILEKNTKEYLEITSPLPRSVYKIDPFKPKDTQKIKPEFATNVKYDKFFWFLDGKKFETENNLIEIKNGKHDIQINLMKDG